MPLILNQKRYALEFDDIVGQLYHFPQQYVSYIQTGETFVYYHPFEGAADPERYYFGMGRIGTVRGDPARSDHYYAEVLDYVPFEVAVPYTDDNGRYLEWRSGVGTRFFSSARRAGQEVFDRILEAAQMEHQAVEEFGLVNEFDNVDKILTDLNEHYADLDPRAYQRLVSQIDRPTSISRALKKKLGYKCQVCGVEGFQTKAGGRYVEAHHLRQLHELIPGSLITENVVIVCASCHSKLHYAHVSIETVNSQTLRIVINDVDYMVELNVF